MHVLLNHVNCVLTSQDILGFFLRIFSDDAKTTNTARQLAMDKYYEVSMSTALKSKRVVLLDGLISLIRHGKSVGQLVYVIRRMLEDIPAEAASNVRCYRSQRVWLCKMMMGLILTVRCAQDSNTRSQVVVTLQQRSKILDILIDDFVSYRESVRCFPILYLHHIKHINLLRLFIGDNGICEPRIPR